MKTIVGEFSSASSNDFLKLLSHTLAIVPGTVYSDTRTLFGRIAEGDGPWEGEESMICGGAGLDQSKYTSLEDFLAESAGCEEEGCGPVC
jgi:hypothetical protein